MSKITSAELSAFLDKVRPQGRLRYVRLANAFDGHRFSDGKLTVTVLLAKGDPEAEAVVEMVNGYGRQIGNNQPVIKDGDVANLKGIKPAPGHYVMALKATPNGRLAFVDAAKNKIDPTEFEDGDLARVRISAYDYTAAMGKPGISLWLRAVQLVEKAAGDFDEVEGGYVAPVANTNTPAAPVAVSVPVRTVVEMTDEEIDALPADLTDTEIAAESRRILAGISRNRLA